MHADSNPDAHDPPAKPDGLRAFGIFLLALAATLVLIPLAGGWMSDRTAPQVGAYVGRLQPGLLGMTLGAYGRWHARRLGARGIRRIMNVVIVFSLLMLLLPLVLIAVFLINFTAAG